MSFNREELLSTIEDYAWIHEQLNSHELYKETMKRNGDDDGLNLLRLIKIYIVTDQELDHDVRHKVIAIRTAKEGEHLHDLFKKYGHIMIGEYEYHPWHLLYK